MSLNDDEDWIDVNSDWLEEDVNESDRSSSKIQETEDSNSSSNNNNLQKEEFVFCEKLSESSDNNNKNNKATLTIAIASTDNVAVNTSSTITKEEVQPSSPNTNNVKVDPPEICVPSVTVVASSKRNNSNKNIPPKDKCQALEAAMSRATENLAESLSRAFTDFVGDADITPPYSGKIVQHKYAW